MTVTDLSPVASRLAVPGADLYYECRGAGPLLVLVGAPMKAEAFAPLAENLASTRTVLTTDPRGIGRSRVGDRGADSTPELRAEDLACLIEHMGIGAADVFGSSGGAVTVLALAQSRPDLVGTVIAHEPPLNQLLADREELRQSTQLMCELYVSGDIIGAWKIFFDSAEIPISPEMLEDMFGGERDKQDVADEYFWFANEMRSSTWWLPDVARLRQLANRVVVGIGADSTGQECDRTSRALCKLLNLTPMTFLGDHTGFVDHPVDFAGQLESVLAGS